MAAERDESSSGRLEQLVREAMRAADEGRPPGFSRVILGVVGPPPEAADADPPPPDRIVLVNPVTQGMVVLQADPAVVAEILSERGVGGGGGGPPPPASKASIEAMRTVDVGEEEGAQQEECPVCLDGLGGGKGESAATVREMPCRHRFHEGCIVKWLGVNGSCPVCRFRMPAEEAGGSKKGDGEGVGEEEAAARRRRRRGIWVTVVYSRRRSTESSSSPEDQDGGGGDGDEQADQ